jgi:hypothetical protein
MKLFETAKAVMPVATILAGFCAFVLQWMIVNNQNDHSAKYKVIKVIMLGRSGIYTSYRLGLFYYITAGFFVIGLILMILAKILKSKLKR